MPELITLQFSAKADWISRGISWLTACPFSHVDAVLDDDRLLGACMGDGCGVEIRPAKYARWKRRVRAEIECHAAERELFYSFLWSQIGKPYDNLALLGFLAGRDWRNEGHWTCAQLVARAFEVSGVVYDWGGGLIDPAKMTPGMLICGITPVARFAEI